MNESIPSANAVIEVFNEARVRPAGPDREQFLAAACGADAKLRAEVDELLGAREEAGSFLKPGAGVSAELEAEFARLKPEEAGERIGPYKLREQIGEGGFGTVWVADQEKPVRRRVALKIIKMGMDTKEVIARFEQERQALAMMDHPNIAQVFDAGATQWGRPFFVMELVKGMPITQYCDEAGLGTRERLARFGDVCSAINHAHQKGVIHRDIKPSNVMVTLHGDKPVVKVIDFGVAKATQGRLTDHTVYTQFEQMVGTPAYMSPEQAGMSGLDVDTRSDIYALGVLLYELLIGKPPFDGKSLADAGYEEMRRIIREVEPVKPSSRLSTIVGEERTLLAKSHRIEPEKIGKLVEPDLDWIVMKAIDKDRARRYETANAFAQDIRRFLADEPVSATPPSAGYQFRKFARRHKAAFRVAAGIALLLVAATAVSSWQAVRATRAEKQAKDEAVRAATAEELARAEAQRATEAEKLAGKRLAESEQARKEAETIANFMSNVFVSPAPGRAGRHVTVVESLNRAAKKLETDLADQPATRIRLQRTLSFTYFRLGLVGECIPIAQSVLNYYRATLGSDHPQTLDAVSDLVHCYQNGNRPEDAIKLAEENLPLMQKRLGLEHPVTLWTTLVVTEAYFKDGRKDEAMAMRKGLVPRMSKVFGPGQNYTLWAMSALAESLDAAGQKEDALTMRKEIATARRIDLGPEHPYTLWAMHTLAVAYYGLGQQVDALKLEEKVVAVMQKVLEPKHPWTITADMTLRRWRGQAPATPESPAEPRLADMTPPPPSLSGKFADSEAKEFWGDRAQDTRVTRLAKSGLKLDKLPEGTWEADLTAVKDFSDLSIFQGTRLSRLNLTGTAVVDLTPLRGLPLRELILNETKVADLEPLRGMPLKVLRFTHTRVSDLAPLSGMPLTKLYANGTMVGNIEPLHGMALTDLSLADTKVSDLSVLRGMPLISLKLGKCMEITDLSPLRDCKSITALTLPPNAKDIGFLRSFQGLRRISYTETAKAGWVPDKTAAEFWKDYDAGKQ